MKKYRLEYITWKDQYNYFHSNSFLDIYNKYHDIKCDFNVEINFYLHQDAEYHEMEHVLYYLEDAKKRYVIRNWSESKESFLEYLDKEYKI